MKSTNHNQPFKILLVEDEQLIAKAYQDGLERAGFQVTIAENGNNALDQIKIQPPDLILLDLILPDLDGFGVLEELNQDEQLKMIPVIVLTVSGQESDIQKSKALGAIDYLVKTDFSMEEIIQRVRFRLANLK